MSEVDRRTELAKLIVDSDYMAKAMVNRMWAHFLGYGFTKPIDDMGPHNPPTHPELLERLGARVPQEQLQPQGADPLDRAERAVFAVQPLDQAERERRSVAGREAEVQQLLPAADEGRRAVRIAARRHRGAEDAGSYEEQEKAKADWLRQFTIAFGTDEGDEATTFNGTIPQALMMFNGDLVRKATGGEQGSFLRQVAANPNLNYEGRVNYLFLAALGAKGQRQAKCGFATATCWSPARATSSRPCKTCSGPCSTATSSS